MRLLPILAALLLVLAAGRPAPASPWIYGIHWYGDANLGDVEAMTGGKPIWVLETVMVNLGGWDMGSQAQRLQRVRDKGHTIIIRIEPTWGYSIPRPADRAQYLVNLRAAVEQARNFCNIWQIGNEMNLYAEYGGEVLTAEEYIGFYKQVRAVIKGVTSPLGEQQVLVGPVSPGAYFGEVRHTAGSVYLEQMCRLLQPGDTDGFALHSYGAPWLDGVAAANDFMTGLSSQIAVIDREGFCNKPLYVTEWNRQTNPPGDAEQERQTAIFLRESFRALDAWNRTPGNHPVVAAMWFIYPPDPAWQNFSIRHLRDVGPRGDGLDLFDTFTAVAAENLAAGSSTPTCAPVTPAPSPTPDAGIRFTRESAGTSTGLSLQPSSADLLHNNVATRRLGGFHPVNTNPADQERAFTDGAGLGGLTGLLMDYPGDGNPAWSGYWILAGGATVDLGEIRVFSGNRGKDGRVFHHYDVYTSDATTITAATTWTPLLREVTSAPYGTRNAGTIEAMLTRVTRQTGNLATGVRALRIDFYATSKTDSVMHDPWRGGHVLDRDGGDEAVESPLIFEVDVFSTAMLPTPSPTATVSPSPSPSRSPSPSPSPSASPTPARAALSAVRDGLLARAAIAPNHDDNHDGVVDAADVARLILQP